MNNISIYQPDFSSFFPLPFAEATVQAGFPTPAEGSVEKRLDLNDLVIQHPTATFFVRVEGFSMTEAGIEPGDILIVDRSLAPCHGKTVIAIIDGEFTVKKLSIEPSGVYLVPAHPRFKKLTVDENCQIWGVVTYVIHKTR